MAKFRARSDLDTYITANFLHANVTGISALPTITIGTETKAADAGAGLIHLGNQTRGANQPLGSVRNEVYFVDGFVRFVGATTDQTINEMLAEMDRIFNVNNNTPAREWWFEFSDALDDGSITHAEDLFAIECVRLGVSSIS